MIITNETPINIIQTIFSKIWNGLDNVNVPGFSFSFADVFLAILTAGFIGMIMKAAFNVFESHFSHELNDRRNAKLNEKRLAERKAGKRGKDD